MSVAQLLKQQDYEHYLFSLFLPGHLRPAVWAILAFHAELTSIPGKIHEPLAGAMRLAWWRERLDDLYAGKPPPGHEVLAALAPVLKQHSLPKNQWDRLFAVYGSLVEGEGCRTEEEAGHLAGEMCAPWLHLIAALENVGEEGYAQRESMAKAYGLLRLPERHASLLPRREEGESYRLFVEDVLSRQKILHEKIDKKTSGNDINHKIFVLLSCLCSLHVSNIKSFDNKEIPVERLDRSPLFPLRFWGRVLLTK